MKRPMVVAVFGVSLVIVVVVSRVFYINGPGKTTNVPNDHGGQIARTPWPASASREETVSTSVPNDYGEQTASARTPSPPSVPQEEGRVNTHDTAAGLTESTNPQAVGVEYPEDTLPPDVIDGVEKFVFFMGYPRSGHSIIGSMMDAHPNMIISYEFELLTKLCNSPSMADDKTSLFNAIYQKSREDVKSGWHSPTYTRGRNEKGYSLDVDTQWHGKYNKSLKVIGDKNAKNTIRAYDEHKDIFKDVLSRLSHTIGRAELRVLHVVRNPYDMIATGTLYGVHSGIDSLYTLHKEGKVSVAALKGEHYSRLSRALQSHSKLIIHLAERVVEVMSTFNLTVLETHTADFTKDPRRTISSICDFLDLPCSEDYLQMCYDKAYKNPSRTRDLVAWPEDVRTYVDAALEKFPFFRRYSFEGED